MKKKLIALVAACSMISTIAMGLVQTAYAADPAIRVEVTEGATANQKVLTYYYENISGILDAQGYFDIDDGVTIDDCVLSIGGKYNDSGAVEADVETGDPAYGYFMISDGGKAVSTADGSFLTVTITVPGDADVAVMLTIDSFRDADGNNCSFAPIETTIEKASSGGGETTVTVTPTVAESKAFEDVDDPSDCAVVGKVELEITGGAYVFNSEKITYGTTGAHPTVTDLNDNALDDEAVNTLIASATDLIVYIVINGTTDVAELDNVIFE